MRLSNGWLASLILLAAISRAGAQWRPDYSHESLGTRTRTAGELANQLRSRMAQPPPSTQSVDPDLLKKLQDMLQSGDTSKLAEILQRDPALRERVESMQRDPALRERLERILRDDPDLQRRLSEGMQNRGTGARTPPRNEWGELLRKLHGDASERPTGNSANSGGPSASVLTPPDTGSGQPASTRSAGAGTAAPELRPPGNDERLRNLARGLEKWLPKNSQNDPTLKRLLNDLNKADFAKKAAPLFKNSPNVNWSKIGRGLDGSSRFLGRNLGRIDPGRIGNVPRISGSRLPDTPSLPSAGAPGAASFSRWEAGGAMTTIFLFVAVALCGFLLWRYLLRPLRQPRATPLDELGPWPVDPEQVQTREEIVQAFDYLALLKCGTPARVWNHRAVANRLGADDPQRRSARLLADTYQHARYAPSHEDLTSDQIDAARRELCFLAGVTAS